MSVGFSAIATAQHFLFLIFKPGFEHCTGGDATPTNWTERQCWLLQCPRILLTCFRARMSALHSTHALGVFPFPRALPEIKGGVAAARDCLRLRSAVRSSDDNHAGFQAQRWFSSFCRCSRSCCSIASTSTRQAKCPVHSNRFDQITCRAV